MADGSIGSDTVSAQEATPSSGSPVSSPPAREAGHDRCAGGSKPPHVGETWRHRRTGITDRVVHRYCDSLYVAKSAMCWPVDLFLQHWERVS